MLSSTPPSSWIAAAALLVGAAACNLGDYEPDPSLQIDAGIDSPASLACSGACHGSGDQAAPPTDTSGLSDTSYTGVGAHQVHLSGSDWHKPVDCESCHVVPLEIGAVGHIDTELPAEITPTGMMEGTAWNGATCTNSYCHGSALTGGTDREPQWTQIDGSASECGSCHGAPPPAPHPADPDCGSCHPSMNPGDGMVIAYPELHIDGHLDVLDAQSCDSCHGSGGASSPPSSVSIPAGGLSIKVM